MEGNDIGTFSSWDYVVLVVMLLISAGIGVYYRLTGGRQKTTEVSNYVICKLALSI
jgi:sodium-coupled monocarboxylate transporter 8/12